MQECNLFTGKKMLCEEFSDTTDNDDRHKQTVMVANTNVCLFM